MRDDVNRRVEDAAIALGVCLECHEGRRPLVAGELHCARCLPLVTAEVARKAKPREYSWQLINGRRVLVVE